MVLKSRVVYMFQKIYEIPGMYAICHLVVPNGCATVEMLKSEV